MCVDEYGVLYAAGLSVGGVCIPKPPRRTDQRWTSTESMSDRHGWQLDTPPCSDRCNDFVLDPVHVTHAGDDSGRLFVVEKAGRIRIVRDGALFSPNHSLILLTL